MKRTILLSSVCAIGLIFLLTGLQSCKQESNANSVAELEAQYRELTATKGTDPEAIKTSMLNLAQAYEAASETDSTQSAEYLYKAAEMYETNMLNVNKAVQVLDRILTEHPDHERAADALFKKGYAYHEYFGDLKKAEAAYASFLQKYPDHELVESAQFELKYLGVPAKDLLERIQQADSSATEAGPN